MGRHRLGYPFAITNTIYAGDLQPNSTGDLQWSVTGNCLDVVDQASDAAYSEGNGYNGDPVCGASASTTLTFLA